MKKVSIKLIIVTIVSLVMLIGGIIFAVNYKKESIKYFANDGYIINNVYNNEGKTINKEYFDSKTTYQTHSDNEYEFTNSDGDKVVIDEASFVHYNDESIMALKDGVAIDLSKIDAELISYYNIFTGAKLTKTNNGYEINNLDDTIQFEKLMFKLSDNKYLIVANDIVISFSDDQTITMENFVEIEYVKENVIRIYNDKSNYQTITSNLYVLLDDIKIDLGYKTISKNNVEYLTMADMVINADDNIEVLPQKVNKEENNTEDGSGNNGSGTNNSGNVNNDGVNTPNVDQNTQTGTDEIPNINDGSTDSSKKEEIVNQPIFNIEIFDVSPLGYTLKAHVEDMSGVLTENMYVEVVENSTGQIVVNKIWDEGLLTFDDYEDTLKPNTTYTLNIKGQYEIENVKYNKIFVSKMFRTLDSGIEIIEDYKTSNSLNFKIYKGKNTTYEYYVNGGNCSSDEKEDYDQISCNNLKVDSTYKVLVDVNTIDGKNASIKISENIKTLKEFNFVNSSVNYNIITEKIPGSNDVNKKIKLEFNVNDPYNGIKEYIYKVYENGNCTGMPIVYTTEKSTLKIDVRTGIKSYCVQTGVKFDDNEKTVISFKGGNTQINLDSVLPQVVGFDNKLDDNASTIRKDYIISEVIDGLIILDDPYKYFQDGQEIEYIITAQKVGEQTNAPEENLNQGFSTITIRSGKAYLPVFISGLTPDSQYVLSMHIKINGGLQYLGYANASTPSTTPILYLDIEKNNNFIQSYDSNANVEFFQIHIDATRNTESNNIKSDQGLLKQLEDVNLSISVIEEGKENEYIFSLNSFLLENNLGEKKEFLNSNYKFISNLDFEDGYNKLIFDSSKDYKIKATAISIAGNNIPVVINNRETPPKNEFELNSSISIEEENITKNACADCQNVEGLDEEIIVRKNINFGLSSKVSKVKYSITTEQDSCPPKTTLEDGETIHNYEVASNNQIIMNFSVDEEYQRGVYYYLCFYGEDGSEEQVTNTMRRTIKVEAQDATITTQMKSLKYNEDGTANITLGIEVTDIDQVSGVYFDEETLSSGETTINNLNSGNYDLKSCQNRLENDCFIETINIPTRINEDVNIEIERDSLTNFGYTIFTPKITSGPTNSNLAIAAIIIKDASETPTGTPQTIFPDALGVFRISNTNFDDFAKKTSTKPHIIKVKYEIIYTLGSEELTYNKDGLNYYFIKEYNAHYYNASGKSYEYPKTLYGDKYNYIPANYIFTEDPSSFDKLKKIYGVANSIELNTTSEISLYESFRIKENGYSVVYGKTETVVNIEPESNQTLIKTLKLNTSEGECEYDISTNNNGCGDKLTVNKSNGQIDKIILTFTKEDSYTLQYKYEDDADFHLMNAGDEQGYLDSKNIKLLNSVLSENIIIPDASEGGTYSLIDDYKGVNGNTTPGDFNIKFDVNGDFKLSDDVKNLYYKINLYNSPDNKVPVLVANEDKYVGTFEISNNLNKLNEIKISKENLTKTLVNNFTNNLDALEKTDYAMQICFSLDENFDDNKTVCKETNSDKKINLYPQINVLFNTGNFINTYSIFDPYGLIDSTGPTIDEVQDYKTNKGEKLKKYIEKNEYSGSNTDVKVILEYNSEDLTNLYYSNLYLNSFKSIPELTTVEHVKYTVKIYYKILGEIRNTEPKENDISSKGYSLGRSQVRINSETWYSYFLSIDNDGRATALESLLVTSNKLIISRVGYKPIIIYKDKSVYENDNELIEENFDSIEYPDSAQLAIRDANTFTYYSSQQQFQIDRIILYMVTADGSQKTAEFKNSTTKQ